MSTRRIFHFTFGAKDARAAVERWTPLDETDFRSSLERLRQAVFAAQETPVWADDLLRVARAVYLVDKRAIRPQGRQPWTRELHLRIQLADNDRWEGRPLSLLEEMLRVLTSDIWHISTVGGAQALDRQGRLDHSSTATEVALFSGGLDSVAYAAQQSLLPAGPLLLIGHDFADGNVPQRRLFATLRWHKDRRRPIEYLPVGDVPTSTGTSTERSSRSRGFLFAATAVFTAAAHRIHEAIMPENGQLAINPPLTPARLAASSTRSVHPWVLRHLNDLISALGGDVTVRNPFLMLTKGEVCKIAKQSGLSTEDLAATISCGNHGANRRQGNCGYCFPCLIRRSGLEAALGEDPTHYESDLNMLTSHETSQHLVDLRQWIARPFTARDLIADIPLPDNLTPRMTLPTILRGRREIANMLLQELVDEVIPQADLAAPGIDSSRNDPGVGIN